MSTTAARSLQGRCFHHAEREAAARCVECRRSYCRECVAEHSGRMVCANCLRAAASAERPARRWLPLIGRVVQTFAAVAVGWMFFYAAGQTVLHFVALEHRGTFEVEDRAGDSEP